jgi:predicted O-linked N-acetylglucosamine transferase (SPINDLY family)
MGWAELAADSPGRFVELALRIGTDAEFREQARMEVAKRAEALFENIAAVRQLERFFIAAHEAACKGARLSSGASFA